jgi:hypothetical protein
MQLKNRTLSLFKNELVGKIGTDSLGLTSLFFKLYQTIFLKTDSPEKLQRE